MFTFLIILAVIVSALIILIVLIQNPKGGGIAANFSSANQIAGVKKTNEFVEKATWGLSIALLVITIGSRFLYSTDTEQSNPLLDAVQDAGIEAPAPVPQDAPEGAQAIPVEPSPAPEEGGTGSLND
jgi:preprotein translocase subunit SecG